MGVKKIFLNTELVKEELQKLGVEDLDVQVEEINKQLKKIISSYKQKTTLAMQQYESGIPFSEVYKSVTELNLPEWLIKRIEEARLIGNSLQTVILSDGEKYQLNNTLNHLSGREWNNFTKSVFSTFYATKGKGSFAHEVRKIHPSPKPPQLMKEIIEFFTKGNGLVFDYFMGVGGSLLGAGLSGRRAIGIDLNQKYIDAYKEAANTIGVEVFPTVCGDCLDIMGNPSIMNELLQGEEIDLVLLDPPYGNMMSKEKTGADINVYGNVATPFTNDEKDFGNIPISMFYDLIKKSVEEIEPYLTPRGYIVIFIKDMQPSGKEINLLHSEIISKINEIKNINYKGMKIWADKSTKLFPYGYPFSFVANQIHQYILVFRKEK